MNTTISNLTKAEWIEIAEGVACGHSVLSISSNAGTDRVSLAKWLARDAAPADLAARIGTPAALCAEALRTLSDPYAQPGERETSRDLRMRFGAALRERYGKWFADREARAERERAEDDRRRLERERRAEIEDAEREVQEERATECRHADYYNLMTLVELTEREWREGTPDELKRGLSTPEARRAYRLRHGLRWTCAGFGVYYDPKMGACRCLMSYTEDEAGGDRLKAFEEICTDPRFAPAWREIDAINDADPHGDAYHENPFARRDKRLPVTEDAAKALLEHVRHGGSIVGWKPPRTTHRKGKSK